VRGLCLVDAPFPPGRRSPPPVAPTPARRVDRQSSTSPPCYRMTRLLCRLSSPGSSSRTIRASPRAMCASGRSTSWLGSTARARATSPAAGLVKSRLLLPRERGRLARPGIRRRAGCHPRGAAASLPVAALPAMRVGTGETPALPGQFTDRVAGSDCVEAIAGRERRAA